MIHHTLICSALPLILFPDSSKTPSNAGLCWCRGVKNWFDMTPAEAATDAKALQRLFTSYAIETFFAQNFSDVPNVHVMPSGFFSVTPPPKMRRRQENFILIKSEHFKFSSMGKTCSSAARWVHTDVCGNLTFLKQPSRTISRQNAATLAQNFFLNVLPSIPNKSHIFVAPECDPPRVQAINKSHEHSS